MWLSKIMPIASELIKNKNDGLGGWLDILSRKLVIDNELVVVSRYVSIETKIEGNLRLYTFDSKVSKSFFTTIIKKERPDVIHIWGTEFSYSNLFIEAVNDLGLIDKTIVSIQGLISIIGKYHYNAYLPNKIVNSHTFRELVTRNNIKKQQKGFIKRGEFEKNTIMIAKNIIGRTDFDNAVVHQINPHITYYKINDNLRETFYKNCWSYEKCDKHSIFISQGSYPLKGLHIAIEALKILKRDYPLSKIYITGESPLEVPFYKITSYQKYIKKLILSNNLADDIIFLGTLNEKCMCNQYLKSNVFVSCSSIENSSNAIGEALALGMPIVASDVGGTKDYITHQVNGFLYQADAPYMLAFYISKCFNNLYCKYNPLNIIKEKFDIGKNVDEINSVYNILKEK